MSFAIGTLPSQARALGELFRSHGETGLVVAGIGELSQAFQKA
jgi:hypothetical protein